MENTTQVIENATNEVSTNIEKPSIGEMTLGQLLNHVRGLWLNPGNRISRGEYILAGVPFSIITSLIGLVSYKALGLSVYSMISIVLSVISMIMGIRLMVARLHDRNKSGRNALWVLGFLVSLVALGAFAGIMAMGGSSSIESLKNSPYIAIIMLLILLVLVSIIGMIVLGIKLVFFKGTPGDNQYGHDPLLRQDVSDSNYWILAIIGIILSIAISLGLPKNQNMTMGGNGQNLFAPNGYNVGADKDDLNKINQIRNNPDMDSGLLTDDKAITQ